VISHQKDQSILHWKNFHYDGGATTIDSWIIIIGGLNLLLFGIGLIFFLPRSIYQQPLSDFQKNLQNQLIYIVLIICVVAIHLIEVNLLDPITTAIVGTDFAPTITQIENGAVYWFTQHWTPLLIALFVFFYIIVYPFTLWFSPFYFLIANEKQAMKTLAHGLILLYIIAIPFYLFLPITNVYSYYHISSPLETIIPSIDHFYYSTTTVNNTFPSLHVAMTLLITQAVTKITNKKYTYFVYLTAAMVIISVIYLAIHWLLDVLAGILLAITIIVILNKIHKR